MAAGSKRVIYAALAGNSLIAVTKFIAATLTGSSAMLSEAIHSVVDTGNQALLLYGLRRAQRPPDEAHPFGYGREVYFWSFVVAILIFAVGAGVSLYEGVSKVRAPTPVVDPHVNYIVLGLALVFEGAAWWVAARSFRAGAGRRGLLRGLRVTKDPSLIAVLLEDTAAMLGLLVAMVALLAAQVFAMPVLDGVASLIIGVILATAAVVLATETKGLLIGEGVDPAVLARIRRLISAQPGVRRLNELLTMHLGPDDVLVNISLDFEDGLDSARVEEVVSELERRIKATDPAIRRVFIAAQSWQAHARARRRRPGRRKR